MARNAKVQELLDQFVVPQATTGVRRAIGTQYRTLANNMAQQLQDSGELVEALQLLLDSKSIAIVGGLNPRPVPDTATVKPTIKGGATPPRVEGGRPE